MMNITGSKLPLVMACSASAALPQVDDMSPAAPRDRGSVIHKYLELVATMGRDAALGHFAKIVDEQMLAFLSCIDTDRLPVHLSAETAFAWNWRTRRARPIGRRGEAGYLGVDWQTEIPMTLDLSGQNTVERFVDAERREVKRVFCGDYKSGFAWLPRPRAHAQVMLGALSLADVHGAEDATVALIRVTDNEPIHMSDEVDRWDLDGFADDVERSMIGVERAASQIAAGQTPDTVMGPHCTYCPARRACPAQTALIRHVTSGRFPTALDQPVSDAQVVEAFDLYKRAEALVGQLGAELYRHLSQRPAQLPDGQALGIVEKEKRYINGDKAEPVVRGVLGDAAVSEAFKFKTSAAAIKRAVSARINGMVGPDGRKAKISTKNKDGVYDKIAAAIEARGGIDIKRSYPIAKTSPDRIYRGALPSAPAAEPIEGADDE